MSRGSVGRWGAEERRSGGAEERRSGGAEERRSWGADNFGYNAQEIPPKISFTRGDGEDKGDNGAILYSQMTNNKQQTTNNKQPTTNNKQQFSTYNPIKALSQLLLFSLKLGN
ncbi:MAG: hypothetical protein F6K41_06755 [Symploca sp. SIO3E6]|nr:hypothetical protein [Caldora sp. SIO3E6]